MYGTVAHWRSTPDWDAITSQPPASCSYTISIIPNHVSGQTQGLGLGFGGGGGGVSVGGGGPMQFRSPPRTLLSVRNVTAHQSTANVPITTVLLYNGPPLLCGFNNNNNNNKHDNVYGAVIMAEPLREFTRFI